MRNAKERATIDKGPKAPTLRQLYDRSGLRWSVLGALLLVVTTIGIWSAHSQPLAVAGLFMAVAGILHAVPEIMRARTYILRGHDCPHSQCALSAEANARSSRDPANRVAAQCAPAREADRGRGTG